MVYTKNDSDLRNIIKSFGKYTQDNITCTKVWAVKIGKKVEDSSKFTTKQVISMALH